MSATVPKCLCEGTMLPNAAAVTPGLYVTPTNLKTIVKKATVTNTDTAARTVTFSYVPSGGTDTDAKDRIWSARSLYPGQSLDIFEAENHVMEAGDWITAFADTAAVVAIRISGIEVAI